VILQLPKRTLDLGEPQIMGVLNVTPDSFSDGGRYLDPDAALERAREMCAEGARLSMSAANRAARARYR